MDRILCSSHPCFGAGDVAGGGGGGSLPSCGQEPSPLLHYCRVDTLTSTTSPSAVLQNGRTTSAEKTAAVASNTHSLAEKRRRERINGHLSTLRCMIPDAAKMDKATLLGAVIQEIRSLEGQALDAGRGLAVPSEVNQVSAEYCEQDDDKLHAAAAAGGPLVRASFCCDDRPALFCDAADAFHGLGLRPLCADVVSVGGRVRVTFLLSRAGGDGDPARLSFLAEKTKRALGGVASLDEEESTRLISKRRRFFQIQRPLSGCPRSL